MKKDRILRTYERTAYKEHSCDYCSERIMPGDRYSRDIMLAKGKFKVYKMHIFPECPPIKRHIEEMGREIERDRERELRESALVEKAA